MMRATLLFVATMFSAVSLAQAPAPRESQQANKPQKPTAPGSTESGKPAAPRAGVAQKWTQIAIPPLPKFNPQEPKRFELSNGMIVFLQEDHELPLIDGTIMIRGGNTEIPNEKAGMIGIYGSVWRLGGTEKLTGDQMDDYLESRAARVSTGGGIDSTSVNWSCLKDDFNDVFNLAVDLLQHPAFRQDKLDLAKTQARSGIARRNDDIESIVGREMSKIAYGANTPYGRTAEYDTIAAITRDDLVAFHKAHIYPNNMIVGVTGDFDSAQMEAALRKAFESWPKGPADNAPKVPVTGPKPGVYFAEKTDVNQSEVRLFHIGIEKTNPDLFAIDVMDQIYFSGGFSSRMMNDIRTKRGLAYSAGGAMTAPYDHPGLFFLEAGTKSQSTVEAIQAIKELVRNIETDKEPPTEAEMKRAKDSILNSFIFTVDSKDKILSERMTYEFYHFPADWLERYRAGIEKVTLPDVTRVAKQYIHPDKLATLVVGNPSEFDKPINTLGQVTTLDISIPPPGSMNKSAGGSAPAAGPANSAEAKALLAKVVNALGGKQKLQDVKAVKRSVDSVQKGPQGDMNLAIEQTVVYPDKLYQQIQTPMGAMTQVIAPGGSFMAMGEQSRDLPSSQAQEGVKRIHHDFVYVAQHAEDPKTQVSLGGTEKVGSVDAQVLEIKDADGTLKWYVDPSSGLIVRAEQQVMSPQGPAQTVTDYSNWKPVSGVMFPFAQTQTMNGEPSGGAQVKTIEVNPTVDPKLFEKPAAPKQ